VSAPRVDAGRVRRLLAALLASALIAVGIGACGGDDEPSPAPSEETASVPLEKGRFNPRAIYDKVAPGVVTVISLFGEGPLGSPQGGQGSGFVVSESGEVVTNAHVVTQGQGGSIEAAREVFVDFPDRNRVEAKVLGFDPFYDVALLKVDPGGLKLTTLELGSGAVGVGEPVAAIGSPFGEEQSLSTGVVSATDRSVESLTQFRIDGAIQTDAAINRGNSGGPLLDADARVIGINQQIETSSGSNSGVGFAVPVGAVKRSLDQIRDDGEVEYAYLGVSTQQVYPQLADELGLDTEFGALIADVVKGGPAAKAGLKGGSREIRFQGSPVSAGGDVILAVDGEDVVRESDLARLISAKSPGEQVTLRVLRGDDERDVTVTLGRRPLSAQQG
jgi:S1-C subfamily serine protease